MDSHLRDLSHSLHLLIWSGYFRFETSDFLRAEESRLQVAAYVTLDLALQTSGCDQVHVLHKPRLLSDNGSSYVSGELAE